MGTAQKVFDHCTPDLLMVMLTLRAPPLPAGTHSVARHYRKERANTGADVGGTASLAQTAT